MPHLHKQRLWLVYVNSTMQGQGSDNCAGPDPGHSQGSDNCAGPDPGHSQGSDSTLYFYLCCCHVPCPVVSRKLVLILAIFHVQWSLGSWS